eukprot:SAG11_NODE_33105_length_279_cov_0.577778_1_plen_20_part_01
MLRSMLNAGVVQLVHEQIAV